MAKRNRRRRAAGLVTAPRHENDWSTELELLAYLTHCLKGRPNVDLFKATISDHIGKTVKVSWKRREVDRCIRSLWRHNQAAGYDKCDHETLYYHGIDVLDFGDNDLRLKCRIRERAQQISWELAQERGFERVTRSQRVSNHIGLEDTLNVWGTTVSRNRGKVTVEVPVRIPESVKVSYGSPPSRLTNLIDGQPHVTASIPRLEASSTEPLQRAPSVPDSEDFEQSSALPTASASPETELFGAAEEHYSIAATDNFIPTSPIPATRRHDEANVSLRTESPGNQSFRELGAQERHIFELTKQTEFYRQELIAVQKRNGDLQRQVDAIKDVEATTSASDRAALKAQLAQHYAEIQCLRTQLNNKAALQPFTRTDYTYPLGPEKKFVTDAVSSIEADTFNLLVSPETTDSESKVDVKSKGADLSVLWTTVFGDPAAKLSGVTFQAVVRSLTTAALCKWVLEPHLEEPLFANCYRGEVILELLANQDGPEVARRLDFAALETMYRREHYQQKVIPGRAATLAQRLFKALSPLIDAQSRRRKTRIRLHTAWRSEVKRLKQVFEAALRLKAMTMTGEWLYEVILPASGAVFQEQYMRVEEGGSEAGSVQLALALGICCYKQTSRDPDSNSFCCSRLAPNVSPVWIHKAAVQL